MGSTERVLQAAQLRCQYKFCAIHTLLVGLSGGWMPVECGLVSCLNHAA